MNIQPSTDLKKVNLQAAVGYLISLHDNEVDWNLLGIKVIGHIDALPIPEGTYEYGDAYMVGTETPYDMYIYTRPDGNVHTDGYWFPVGKFPMPGTQGPKGDGVETLTSIDTGSSQYATYDTTGGISATYDAIINYKDSSTGESKSQTVSLSAKTPILPGQYISISNHDSRNIEVGVDDTALALDYFKINKTLYNYVPWWYNGSIIGALVSSGTDPGSLALRLPKGQLCMTECRSDSFSTRLGNDKIDFYAIYNNTVGTEYSIDKTSTDTGTLTTAQLLQLYGTDQGNNRRIIYDGNAYIRMDPINAPDGTLNYIHIDSIEGGNGGYKATGKCFSITVSTRSFQVFDVDFGSTRTTHNLTLTNSSTETNIYFSLTNNRPETYEGAPAELWAALENSRISCTVNIGGNYSVGMITTEGDNFKVFYGNSEEMTITQTEMAITDNMV